MSFANFEIQLSKIIVETNLNQAVKIKESFTERKNINNIVSFSLTFINTHGKIIFEETVGGKNSGGLISSYRHH